MADDGWAGERGVPPAQLGGHLRVPRREALDVRLLPAGVEQAQVHCGRLLRIQRKVDAAGSKGGPERIGLPRPNGWFIRRL